jgi:hypothetical protein
MRLLAVCTLALAAALGLALGGSVTETIYASARPTVVRYGQPVTMSGSVGSGRGDQLVTVRSLPCDQTSWRDVTETTTQAGGSWSVDFNPGISGLYRAVSGDAASEPVKLQQRPFVYLTPRPPGRFRAGVQAQRPFWHRKMRVERFDAKSRKWLLVRTLLLTFTDAGQGSSVIFSGSDPFRLSVPKGTTLRATLPLKQARPCYLAGYSQLLRT